MSSHVRSVEVEGFLSIRAATVELSQLNVLVGANGAGKSNLVRVFELLGRMVDEELGLFVGLNGGASAILHDGDSRIRLSVDAREGQYQASLLRSAGDRFIFGEEGVALGSEHGGKGLIYGIGGGYQESSLSHSARGDFEKPLQSMVRLLRGCRVFHFHDTSPNAAVKQNALTADNLALRSDAGNLAAVLLNLREANPTAYRRIVAAVQLVAPFFRDFVLQPEISDRIRLRWRQVDSDTVFSAHQMSDGTLRFACLATLLLQPDLPGLVVLDEPELGLHPFAIMQLADLLRQAANRSQVLFATQSVTLISQFELSDVIVAERQDGASVFRRPDPERLTQWLSDYSLGELWEKNLLGGGPRREKHG